MLSRLKQKKIKNYQAKLNKIRKLSIEQGVLYGLCWHETKWS
jgi:hypothetical protein